MVELRFHTAMLIANQPFALLVLIAITSLLVAMLLNKSTSTTIPPGFTWGHFMALSHLIWALLILYVGSSVDADKFVGIWMLMLAVASVLTLKLYKCGWIALTVLSLNPIIWLINLFYSRKRLIYLLPNASLKTELTRFSQTRAQRVLIIAFSVFACVTIAAVTYGHLSKWTSRYWIDCLVTQNCVSYRIRPWTMASSWLAILCAVSIFAWKNVSCGLTKVTSWIKQGS